MPQRAAKAELFAALPKVWPHDLGPAIREAGKQARAKLVVLDDDPTGTQTVHDVPVLTTWDTDTLAAELANELPCFYVLTNSRSLPAEAARALALELAANLKAAAAKAGRNFILVSRSDSTLRGHYPAETDALAEMLGPFQATVLVPYFEAGGRYTINDVHYLEEGEDLVPAAETVFARDAVFGYEVSNLRHYVEEKSRGRIRAGSVQSFSLTELRTASPDGEPARSVARRLSSFPPGSVCVVNAAHPRDLEVFVLGALLAEQGGTRLLYRTAAQFVATRLGLGPRLLSGLLPAHAQGPAPAGGLIVVGSYVSKTSEQLERLLATGAPARVELDVPALLDPALRAGTLAQAAAETDRQLAQGRPVVAFTSRKLAAGESAAQNLDIGRRVSAALVELVRTLKVEPRYLIAKGGITSSDLATRGLGVKRALVLGQLLPGVPVWQLGTETRWPGLPYVVFPGNVGGPAALAEAVQLLSVRA